MIHLNSRDYGHFREKKTGLKGGVKVHPYFSLECPNLLQAINGLRDTQQNIFFSVRDTVCHSLS